MLADAATGTPTTTRPASAAFAQRTAATIVAPVASPSSISRTVLPRRSSGACSACRFRSRRAACAFVSSTATASRSAVRPSEARTYTPSPGVTAPMPYSRSKGWPIFRTATTSSGAPSARAISAATSTPPRARPTTTTLPPRSAPSSTASACPAAARSANRGLATIRLMLTGRSQRLWLGAGR